MEGFPERAITVTKNPVSKNELSFNFGQVLTERNTILFTSAKVGEKGCKYHLYSFDNS